MTNPKKTLTAAAAALLLTGAFVIGAPAASGSQDEIPDPVKTLFQKRCSGCHKGKFPPKGLSLRPANLAAIIDAPSREVPSLKLVDSKAPEASYLLKKVRRVDGIAGKPMPPGKPLNPAELQTIETWIMGLAQFPVPASALGAPDRGGPGPGSVPERAAPARAYDKPAFWGTRLISLPTTTTPDKGDVLVRISHRFLGPVDRGFDDLFGLDDGANILFSLGYGITDHLTVSIGRARLYKEFEFSADWLIAEQGLTARLPFSAALHAGVDLATASSPDETKLFASLSLSRQLTKRLSILAVPAFVTNANHLDLDPESTFSLGLGARYMIFEDFSVTAEWVPVLAGYKDVESGWGLGIEKKIGGHVFQVFVTNAFGLTAAQALPGGDLLLGDFDFRIGFNIFRTF